MIAVLLERRAIIDDCYDLQLKQLEASLQLLQRRFATTCTRVSRVSAFDRCNRTILSCENRASLQRNTCRRQCRRHHRRRCRP